MVSGALWVLMAVLSTLLATASAGSSSDGADEYEIKAAFLYNFLRFVDWPEDAFDGPDEPFRIGILGVDPFGEILDAVVADRTIDGRSVEVNRGRMVDLIESHLLFVSDSEAEVVEYIVNALHDHPYHPVLTVSDIDGFAERGGIIEFYFRDQRIAFRVNVSASERNRLEMSSRLLSLATVVYESSRPAPE